MLELKNISYEVEGKKILDGIDLKVSERFVVITGPNGSGKSTLAKIVAGVLQPTGGSIIYEGKDITNMPITDRANLGIGYAFQQPVKFKGITVKDIMSIAAGKNVTTAQACNYLSDVGLCAKEYIGREVDASLSGGELKRIEIATVLARGSRLSVFDEPEAGIDLWSFSNLIRIFEMMQNKSKGSILIISHQERILEIADKIVVLAAGKIDRMGAPAEIMPKLKGVTAMCELAKGAAT